MKLRDKLKAKQEAALARMKALTKLAETEDRSLTDAEATEFETEQKAFDSAEVELKRLDKADEAEARFGERAKAEKKDVTGNIAKAVERSDDNDGSTIGQGNQQLTPAGMFGQRKMSSIERVGVIAWATAKNKHYPMKSPEDHLDDAGFGKLADDCRAVKDFARREKTFLTTGGSAGANTIMTPLDGEFIEFLQNESMFFKGGPVPVDLSYGKLDIAAGNAKTTAGYVAEGAASNATEATTRKVSLSAKHLTAITAIGNYNIEVSPLAVASILGDELAQTLVLAMDSAGLRGTGSGSNPSGIYTLTNAANKFAITAVDTDTPTLAEVDADAKKTMLKLAAANIPVRRRRWLMANRIFLHLMMMRDGNGNYAYPKLQDANPTWFGNYPVIVSEQIPTNLGTGTDESEVYLVDFGHVLFGQARVLTLKTSTEASYKNSGGTLVSAFAQDETVIRGIASHDFAMRHDKAAAILTGVRWGA